MTVHNAGISLILSTSVWVLLSPPKHVERLDQWLNVPIHGQCGERRLPKVQPSTLPGIEPRTFWLAVRDLTNCALTSLGIYSTKTLTRLPGKVQEFFSGQSQRERTPDCNSGNLSIWEDQVKNRPLHDGRDMMGNEGKNYSEWVSKTTISPEFFIFKALDFSWSNSKNVFLG